MRLYSSTLEYEYHAMRGPLARRCSFRGKWHHSIAPQLQGSMNILSKKRKIHSSSSVTTSIGSCVKRRN